jgi:hypothetical protein
MWQRTDAGTNFINDKYCRLSQCAPMSSKSERIQVVCFRWHLITNIEINIDCICWIQLSNYSNLRYVLKRLCLIINNLFKFWYTLADCKDGGLAPSKDYRFGEKSEVANMSRQVEYVVLSRIIKERVLNKTLQHHLHAFAPGCRSAAFAEPGRWLWKRNTMDCQYAITWKDVYVPSNWHHYISPNWEHHSQLLVVQDILRTINITKIYPWCL